MTNYQNYKPMIKRCMELLRTKIACAQTRHIARRAPIGVSDSWPKHHHFQLAREREKTKHYQEKKQLSMWQQNEQQVKTPEADEEEKRLDDLYYKEKDIYGRQYARTWSNFPEREKPRIRPNLETEGDEAPPARRRSADDRPTTAKPWDDEAKAFINQWDSNQAAISRRKESSSAYCFPTPRAAIDCDQHSSDEFDNSQDSRLKLFFY